MSYSPGSQPDSFPPQIPRKLLHSSISIIVTWLWLQHPNVPFTIRVAANATFVVVSADLLRFRYPAFEELYERALGYFMRESERRECGAQGAGAGADPAFLLLDMVNGVVRERGTRGGDSQLTLAGSADLLSRRRLDLPHLLPARCAPWLDWVYSWS